ncbi:MULTISPECIES: hypothetical protein [Pseudomonas]|uniref:Uncharacterized protein n=1 Tax=Pseudomonas lini TaxID=163011 RepID=A0A0J6HNZ3_9PSED|nr:MULTISPECIES: hypothetical protein [Pseudomonas]KAB0507202.1 hypothetical protein F7R14_04915 [Pseudomonas lini]KMM95515.1 hypothetical protein TU81_03735 [Pseudomonas lini]KNH43657.1 hypothetical protein ACS73_24840 [Pseudomonas lini]MDT9673200.1 hypothetical protein [Pseudomonas sp. JV414]SDT38862.1 hypothetical protein SAMN04490191_4223 [Pseudomonas lini]
MKDESRRTEYHSRDFPVREDMAYQVKVWRFERWGWYVMVLLVVLALLGLFSRGPLSSRDVHGSDGKVRVEYEMFHRHGSTNPMKVSVIGRPDATVELELTGKLLEGFEIETLQPEPVRALSGEQGMKLWVQTDAQGQASLYLTLRGEGLGLFRSHIASPGAASVKVDQFIFP